jgi:hypothetical protein
MRHTLCHPHDQFREAQFDPDRHRHGYRIFEKDVEAIMKVFEETDF